MKGPLLCWSELEHLPVLCYRLPQCVAAYRAGLETATPSLSVTQSKWKMLSGLRAGGPLVPARSWRAGRPVCLGRSPAVVLRLSASPPGLGKHCLVPFPCAQPWPRLTPLPLVWPWGRSVLMGGPDGGGHHLQPTAAIP